MRRIHFFFFFLKGRYVRARSCKANTASEISREIRGHWRRESSLRGNWEGGFSGGWKTLLSIPPLYAFKIARVVYLAAGSARFLAVGDDDFGEVAFVFLQRVVSVGFLEEMRSLQPPRETQVRYWNSREWKLIRIFFSKTLGWIGAYESWEPYMFLASITSK